MITGLTEILGQDRVAWPVALERCSISGNAALSRHSENDLVRSLKKLSGEITDIWINVKFIPVVIWNNGTIYGKLLYTVHATLCY